MAGTRHALDTVPGLSALAHSQSYVVRRSQLETLGVTRHHVRRQLGARRWSLLEGGVVLLHTGTPTLEQRRWAAVLACGLPAVLGGVSALSQAGLRGWDSERHHVLVPVGRRPSSPPGAVLHTTLRLDEIEIDRSRGCPATVVPRSVIDAARWERSPRRSAGIVMAAVQQRLVTPDDLLATLGTFTKVKQQVAIVQAITDAAGAHDSLAEADVAQLVVRAGLPEPRAQAVVTTDAGPRRVDLLVELPDGRPLVIEVDGAHHLDPDVRVRDAAKDAAIIAQGGLVLRIPVPSLREEPLAVLRRLVAIREAAQRRARRPA